MEQWSDIRRRVLVEGGSKRQVLRETGLHWKTLKKILENAEPPGCRQRKPRPRKKLGPHLERIRQLLQQDKHCQRSSVTRPGASLSGCARRRAMRADTPP